MHITISTVMWYMNWGLYEYMDILQSATGAVGAGRQGVFSTRRRFVRNPNSFEPLYSYIYFHIDHDSQSTKDFLPTSYLNKKTNQV